MKSIHEHILHCADGILSTQPVVRKKTGKRLLAVSREALKRIYYLSYAYRMTENVKYAERAEKELLSVCDFTDWNPSHYLDVGEMTMAVAIGYDWLYDFLKDDTRKKSDLQLLKRLLTLQRQGAFTIELIIGIKYVMQVWSLELWQYMKMRRKS